MGVCLRFVFAFVTLHLLVQAVRDGNVCAPTAYCLVYVLVAGVRSLSGDRGVRGARRFPRPLVFLRIVLRFASYC
jgi:hypothetical protein